MDKELCMLEKYCRFVRQTIEICQRQNTVILQRFPYGYCNKASIWLYRYLDIKGYKNITFRMRDPFLSNYDGNHVWLHWKSYDIDITADQFNKKGCCFDKCIVDKDNLV